MATLPVFIGTLDSFNTDTYAKYIIWTLGFNGSQPLRTSFQGQPLSQALRKAFPQSIITEDRKLDEIRDENSALELIERVFRAGEICILAQSAFESIVLHLTKRRKNDELLVEGTRQFQVVKVMKELQRYCRLFDLDTVPHAPSQFSPSRAFLTSTKTMPSSTTTPTPMYTADAVRRTKPPIERLSAFLAVPNMLLEGSSKVRFPTVDNLVQANDEVAIVLKQLQEMKTALQSYRSVETLQRKIERLRNQISQLEEDLQRLTLRETPKVYLSQLPTYGIDCGVLAVNFSTNTFYRCALRAMYPSGESSDLMEQDILPGSSKINYTYSNSFDYLDQIEVVLVQNEERVSDVLVVKL